MIQNKLNIISELFKKYQNDISFETNKFFVNGDVNSIEDYCKSNNIQTEKIADKLQLKLKSFLTPNLICFTEIERTFDASFIAEIFVILNINGDYCFHEAESDVLLFNTNADTQFKRICSNTFNYFKLYNFLKSDEFADHHNYANSEIIIYSSAKGIFKIKYDEPPIIEKSNDISVEVKQLIENAKSIQLRSFFKNAIITFSNGKGNISLNEIIIKSGDIIATTIRDFELVSKQFDFDKFKDSLYKEKEKYFLSIREIINKIFSQAVGIPISISATVFASYKVSDDNLMLLIVLLTFFIYVVFYIKIQLIYRADIGELKNDFTKDFDVIKSKSGLEPALIDSEKTKINRKIGSSISIIDWLIGIVVGLGVLVSWYIFHEVTKTMGFCY